MMTIKYVRTTHDGGPFAGSESNDRAETSWRLGFSYAAPGLWFRRLLVLYRYLETIGVIGAPSNKPTDASKGLLYLVNLDSRK